MGQYDYIIVGAGSAGSVLANRLSANGRHQVLLLEAGAPSHWLSPVPIGVANLVDNPAANWLFKAQGEASMHGRDIPVPRGKLLGGSSAINGMVYVRGQALDYDIWAQLGNRGWSYTDVLPLFQRMENYAGGDDAVRGRDGPLRVTDSSDDNPLYDALFEAADELGLGRNPDYNGVDQEGMCRTQMTIADGRRMSAAKCFLDPARSRRNLVIETGASAQSLIMEGTCCTGVRYLQGGTLHEAYAGCEVISCAGAIKSPQLLEISGIGDSDVLRAHNIEVHHALSGVGNGLRDHLCPRMGWSITQPGVSYNDSARGLGLVKQVLQYAVSRTGFLSLPTAPMLAFMKTRPELETADIQLHFMPFTYTAARKLHARPGITVLVYQMRPESLGSVHIQSDDSEVPPTIKFNFLATENDRRTTVDGVRQTRALMAAKALQRLCGPEFKPGTKVESDDEILDWVRRSGETAYHPVGTCRMGSDPLAVVDEQLRTRGVAGLRVADASIMPTLVSGNTNAPSIMIGEKCADMVLADNAS